MSTDEQEARKAARDADKAAATLATVVIKGMSYAIADAGLVSELFQTLRPERAQDRLDTGPPPENEVDICLGWLKEYATQRKTENPQIGSYGLKHLVEHDRPPEYVSNGAFILAAWRAGYTIYPGRYDSPNCGFNISLGRGWRKRYYK